VTPEAFQYVRALATDIDGVLTDGTFYWGAAGEELKRFCFADVTGLSLARDAGIKLALISGESSDAARQLAQRYAAKLRIDDVYTGCHDKAAALREFAARHSLDLAHVCFVGDDLLDIPAMQIAGISACPADAQTAARAAASFIATRNGGAGVLREIVEIILNNK
jgi:3-deoxy-D-manno-octulosonate 8-phosphate phosphatase (KDO 8-P phosphatase)